MRLPTRETIASLVVLSSLLQAASAYAMSPAVSAAMNQATRMTQSTTKTSASPELTVEQQASAYLTKTCGLDLATNAFMLRVFDARTLTFTEQQVRANKAYCGTLLESIHQKKALQPTPGR